MTTPKYVKRRAAAEYLAYRGINFQPETLSRWASNGRYALPIIKIGRLVRYDRDDLDTLIASHKVVPGGGEPFEDGD